MPLVIATESDLIAACVAAKHATAECVTAIVGKVDEHSGRLAGSGSFLALRGETFLVTAEHVITEGGEKYEELRRRGPGGAAIRIGYCATAPNPLDLAVAHVGNDASIRPAPLHLLATSSTSVSEEHLFVQGFPGKESRFTAFLDAVLSDSKPYLTYTCDSAWPEFDPEIHFAIEYPSPDQLQIDERGRRVPLPPADGVSGSLVWALGSDVGAGWSFASARIVGVAHRWSPLGTPSLIVTRIESVREFLLKAIRERRAYELWSNRGRPEGDALTDWVAAEREIRSL